MEKLKNNLTTIEFVFWKWTPNKAGLCPIKLRVTQRGVRRHYQINHENLKLFLSEPVWKLIQDSGKKIRGENLAIRETIMRISAQARAAIDKVTNGNRPFTWEKFESEFLHSESSKGFLSMFADHLETIRAENRIGTYSAYNTALNAFKTFRKGRELSPFDITPKLLKDFESFLVDRGCGKTTVGMYARALKVVYNIAADEDPTLLENYPFAKKQNDRNKYKIRSGSGHKGEALSLDQLQKLIASKTDPIMPEHEAKLLWLFSFYSQGMNMKDISLLKFHDIRGDVISYVRAKTKDTEVKEAVIEVTMSENLKEIIASIGNPDKRPSSYVFPIVPNGLASQYPARIQKEKTHEERIHEIIKQKIKMVNARLRELCRENDLPEITTYWARHSYASLLKQSGESVEVIRELLGHGDIRTTESYLKRFDKEHKQKINEKITSLLKPI